jgi:signal transduction histidine kinase
MFRFVVFIAYVLICLLPVAQAAPAWEGQSVYVDTSGRMGLEEVLALPASAWRSAPPAAQNFGLSPYAYWLRVDYRAEVDPVLLEVAFPQLDHIDLYRYDGQAWQRQRGGDALPASQRAVAFPHQVFFLPAAADGERIYLRVQSSSALQVPLAFWGLRDFNSYAVGRSLLLGGYYGALAVMLVYNLFLFASVRDRVFVYYVAYLGSLLLLQLALSGDGFVWFWPEATTWTSRAAPVAGALAVASILQLALVMVRAREETPRLYRFGVGGVIFALTLSFLALLLSPAWTNGPLLILAALIVPFIYAISLISARHGVVVAGYFLVAWSVFLLGLLVFVLKMLGVLPYNLLTHYSLLLGSIVEVVLISLALAYRVRLERTARRQAELELQQHRRLSTLKSEFVSTVSHELRTPMTSISGSLKLLLGEAAGEVSPKVRRLLEIANGNAERLLRLINDLLDIERIERDAMPFDFVEQPLAPLVELAVEQLDSYAERRAVSIHTELGDEAVLVAVDADRLVQVVTNLLSNAIKFSVSGGDVIVRLSQRRRVAVLEVIDHGRGIDEAFKPRVFEKFAQQVDRQRPSEAGTGLGLAICQRIVEAHKGSIGFDSKPGVQTRFYVSLPLRQRVVTPA